MTTRSGHYLEAERLLTKAANCVVDSITRALIERAMVHATLATVDVETAREANTVTTPRHQA